VSLEEDHAQAGLALLTANLNLTVFDEKVPDPTPDPPYVLVYSRVAWPRDGLGTSLTALQVTVTTTFTCHCTGLTPSAARAVLGQVRGTLLNTRPVITGRNCSPIKQSDAPEVVRDESLGTAVYDAVGVFDFVSTG
jgi:hypothetical protein